MITAVVFSHNRAAQCHLLLESIRKNIPGVFNTHIIYKADKPEYQSAYNDTLNHFINEHFYGVSDHWNLERYTRQIIEESKTDEIAFFTDSTVIYMLAPLVGHEFLTKIRTDRAVFSLRLGYNTLIQNHHTGEIQIPLHLCSDETQTISWNFNHHHPLSNYGYPFSMDGHIYSRELIRDLIHRMHFKTPAELESNLFHFKHRIPQALRSFKHSIAVTAFNNQYTIEQLNQMYLSGDRIDLEEIMKQQVMGCHQEIPFCMINSKSPKSPTNLKVNVNVQP